jgi:hypothetical protein
MGLVTKRNPIELWRSPNKHTIGGRILDNETHLEETNRKKNSGGGECIVITIQEKKENNI